MAAWLLPALLLGGAAAISAGSSNKNQQPLKAADLLTPEQREISKQLSDILQAGLERGAAEPFEGDRVAPLGPLQMGAIASAADLLGRPLFSGLPGVRPFDTSGLQGLPEPSQVEGIDASTLPAVDQPGFDPTQAQGIDTSALGQLGVGLPEILGMGFQPSQMQGLDPSALPQVTQQGLPGLQGINQGLLRALTQGGLPQLQGLDLGALPGVDPSGLPGVSPVQRPEGQIQGLDLSNLPELPQFTQDVQASIMPALDRVLGGEAAFTPDRAATDELFRSAVADPALAQFQEDILPQIRERFAGEGFMSSARMRAESRAAEGLSRELAAQRAQFTMQDELARRQSLEAGADRAAGALPAALGFSLEAQMQPLQAALAARGQLSQEQLAQFQAGLAGREQEMSEAMRQFQSALAGRQQLFGEQFGMRGQSLAEQLAAAQTGLAQRGQLFGEQLGLRGQEFSEQMGAAQLGLAGRGQLFGEQLGIADTALRQQLAGFQTAMAGRQQFIDEAMQQLQGSLAQRGQLFGEQVAGREADLAAMLAEFQTGMQGRQQFVDEAMQQLQAQLAGRESTLAGLLAQFQTGLAGRQQMFGEALAGRQLGLEEILAQFGADMQTRQQGMQEQMLSRQAQMDAIGQAAQLGNLQRAQQQAVLDAQFQEFLRTRPEASPFIQQALSFLGMQQQALYQPPPQTDPFAAFLGAAAPIIGGGLIGGNTNLLSAMLALR